MELPEFLMRDERDSIFCTGHRIGLADIVHFFNEGYSPEMLASQFPTLALSLLYKVIGFYLDHRAEVDRYIAQEQAQVDRQRQAAIRGPGLDD